VQIIEHRKDILGSNAVICGPLAFQSIGKRARDEKCDGIEQTIQRYRRIERAITDQVKVDRIKGLIADLQAQRDALHSSDDRSNNLRHPSPSHVSLAAKRSSDRPRA
jgi:hypothetical protein